MLTGTALVPDAQAGEAPEPGRGIHIRLHPDRISLKDFLDRVTIPDVLDLLSRL